MIFFPPKFCGQKPSEETDMGKMNPYLSVQRSEGEGFLVYKQAQLSQKKTYIKTNEHLLLTKLNLTLFNSLTSFKLYEHGNTKNGTFQMLLMYILNIK